VAPASASSARPRTEKFRRSTDLSFHESYRQRWTDPCWGDVLAIGPTPCNLDSRQQRRSPRNACTRDSRRGNSQKLDDMLAFRRTVKEVAIMARSAVTDESLAVFCTTSYISHPLPAQLC